ncbi:hypothetical protein BH09GEM1_BH09GEM1_42140 [soil metagenome]
MKATWVALSAGWESSRVSVMLGWAESDVAVRAVTTQ